MGGAKPSILAHCEGSLPVHIRVDAAREGEFSRLPNILSGINIFRAVNRFDLDTGFQNNFSDLSAHKDSCLFTIDSTSKRFSNTKDTKYTKVFLRSSFVTFVPFVFNSCQACRDIALACPSWDLAQDKGSDFIERTAGWKHACDIEGFQGWDISFGNIAANQDNLIVHACLFQFSHQFLRDGQGRSGKNGQTNYIHVFLKGGIEYLVNCLVKSGVDHFKTGIPQCNGNHFCAPVMTVETRLGDENPYRFCCHEVLHYVTASALREAVTCCQYHCEEWSSPDCQEIASSSLRSSSQ